MRKEQVLIPLVREIVKRPKLAELFFRLDPWGNPFTDEMLNDPMTLAPEMRADGPVAWSPLYQQWFFMGYEESRDVLASPHVGTANQMDVLLSVRPYTQLSDQTRALMHNLLLLTDPPDHTRQRALVSRAFTPRQVSRLEPEMDEIVDELIAGFGDRVELMDEFAVPFPAMVIAKLIGFPRQDWTYLRDSARTFSQITDPFRSFDPAEVDAASDELHRRVRALADERRENPADDLMTGLVQAQADDGDKLSDEELVSIIGLILFAGHETTSNMFGLSALHLFNNPSETAKLDADPSLWSNAIEEILRYDPTLRVAVRSALEDFESAGHKIKKGQNIVVLAQLSNRDLRRWSDADELRVDRDDPSPLSFGHGIHYCLGASLARLEMRTALPKLIAALDGYTIETDKLVWSPSLNLRGPLQMHLRR